MKRDEGRQKIKERRKMVAKKGWWSSEDEHGLCSLKSWSLFIVILIFSLWA